MQGFEISVLSHSQVKVGPQSMIDGLAQKRQGLIPPPHQCREATKIVDRASSNSVIRSEDPLADLKRLPIQLLCFLILMFIRQNVREVVHVKRCIGMVQSEWPQVHRLLRIGQDFG
jgi:hypothetical protein